jgi:hypothetical protein
MGGGGCLEAHPVVPGMEDGGCPEHGHVRLDMMADPEMREAMANPRFKRHSRSDEWSWRPGMVQCPTMRNFKNS